LSDNEHERDLSCDLERDNERDGVLEVDSDLVESVLFITIFISFCLSWYLFIFVFVSYTCFLAEIMFFSILPFWNKNIKTILIYQLSCLNLFRKYIDQSYFEIKDLGGNFRFFQQR
jgi:hypothetical protein